MPNGRSIRGSAAEYDHRRAALKDEAGYFLGVFQINRYLNRPVASLIVRAFLRRRVTPNQLTVLSFLIGLAGAAALIQGRPRMFLLGAFLVQASSIVDCADGMLARARGETSEFGAYLDLFLDRLNEFFLFVGYTLGHVRASGRTDHLILGLVATAGYFAVNSLFYLTKAYTRDTRRGETAENRAWLMFLLALSAALNLMAWGIYLLLLSVGAGFVVVAVKFFRHKRESVVTR